LDSPTKKLFRKLDKRVPGFSIVFDPKKIFDLNKNQSNLLEIAASFLLMYEKTSRRKTTRRQFSKLTKKKTLIRQNFRCNSCGNPLEEVDFHHIDGNSSNNHISNCEALCQNCHANKTRKKE